LDRLRLRTEFDATFCIYPEVLWRFCEEYRCNLSVAHPRDEVSAQLRDKIVLANVGDFTFGVVAQKSALLQREFNPGEGRKEPEREARRQTVQEFVGSQHGSTPA
jgi:hypothetical protein